MKDFENMKAYRAISLEDGKTKDMTMIRLIDDNRVVLSDKTVRELINDMNENGGIECLDGNKRLYWLNRLAIKSIEPVVVDSDGIHNTSK
jgi:hypothetical protein